MFTDHDPDKFNYAAYYEDDRRYRAEAVAAYVVGTLVVFIAAVLYGAFCWVSA